MRSHSPSSDEARRLARLVLVTIASGLVLALLLASPGGRYGLAFAQQSPTGSPTGSPAPTGPEIVLLNPSTAYDPGLLNPPRPPDTPDTPKVSDKFDGVDNAYHIVASTARLPDNVIVEAYVDYPAPSGPDCEIFACADPPEEAIELMERVPSAPDTWELFWEIPDNQETGSATLRVRVYEVTGVGTEEVAAAEVDVDIDPDEEALEMTWPTQVGQVGFYKPRGGVWRGVVDGFASAASSGVATQQVRLFYSTTPPGEEAEFTQCASGGLGSTADGAKPWQLTCSLSGKTLPTDLTALAAVALEDDQNAPASNANEYTLESADVHRITGYIQDPEKMKVTVLTDPNSQAPPPGRGLVGDSCIAFMGTVTDHLDRPVQGANLDWHIDGPTDTVGFGDDAGSGGNFASSSEQAPDKGDHPKESQWDCDSPGNRWTDQQGEHNVPGGDDIKHIESTSGSGLSGGGVGPGKFRVHVFSDQPGLTNVQAWVDDEPLANPAEVRPADNDIFEPNEASGTALAQWYSTDPILSLDPAGGTGPAGTCQEYVLRARAGSDAIPRTNVDVHATGPDDALDFCDPGTATPHQAPDGPGPDGSQHEAEDPGESQHAGPSPKTQHTEGETNGQGNFVFGIISPVTGDTQITAWMDKETGIDNDVLDSDEPTVTVSHSWASSSGDAEVRFVNPSGYGGGGDNISSETDADSRFHIVARVDAPDLVGGVDFSYSSNGTNFIPIGSGSRIGTTDTYEFFWDTSQVTAGDYTLRAQIVGTNQLEDRAVHVDNTLASLEVTKPGNATFASFEKGKLEIAGLSSGEVDRIDLYYTKTAAKDVRDADQWILCGTADQEGTSFKGDCSLTSSDQPSQITGVAAVNVVCDAVLGCPDDPNPLGDEAPESGDAHRVFGFDANPMLSLEPAEAGAEPGDCRRFELSVFDQTGQPLSNENVDVHLTGPADASDFCNPTDASPHQTPNEGGHSGSSTFGSGVHEDPTGPDTHHIEGTSNANGKFVFGVTSSSEGDSDILAWIDRAENDEKDANEASDSSKVHWVKTEESKTERFESRASVRYSNKAFRGRVQSDERSCERGRKVVVKKVRQGKDKKVGKRHTNGRGKWNLRRPHAHGRFYAKVTKRVSTASDGTRTVCRPDKTSRVKI